MTQQAGKLTSKQRETLNIIAHWSDGFLFARDLADHLGLSDEASARVRLKPLESAGLIKRESMGRGRPSIIRATSEGLALLHPSETPPRVVSFQPDASRPMPKVGLPCGPLGETLEEVTYISHPFSNWVSGDYIVIAEGDSMWDAQHSHGIPVGAKVQMRPNVMPQNGDVCHVEYIRDDQAHECTMKAFFLDGRSGVVTLRPFNPAYPKIVLPGERIEVRGVAQDVVLPAKTFLKWGRK